MRAYRKLRQSVAAPASVRPAARRAAKQERHGRREAATERSLGGRSDPADEFAGSYWSECRPEAVRSAQGS